MFEGVPQYPTWARIGQIIDKHDVTILYTAPTAIRAMMREGDDYVRQSNRSSLRLLGSVGDSQSRKRGIGIIGWSANRAVRSWIRVVADRNRLEF